MISEQMLCRLTGPNYLELVGKCGDDIQKLQSDQRHV